MAEKRGRTDADLDALVREASALPTDEALLAQKVAARLRRRRADPAGIWVPLPRAAVAGFAAVLVATPAAIFYGGAGGIEDRFLERAVLGGPPVLDPGLGLALRLDGTDALP